MLAWSAASAQAPQDKAAPAADAVLSTVTVSEVRDPVDKSYRKMLQGMDLFERMHSLAPNATLRYKLLPRHRDTNMDAISVSIVGDTVAIPVRVASDHTFTLERDPEALKEDASVMPNRKAQSMTWRTEIRTPGLPPGTRRLGDLRLECHVGMEAGLVSNDPPIIGAISSLIRGMVGYCTTSEVRYLFFSERPLFGVTLIDGARREVLPIDLLYAGVSNGSTSRADLPYCDCEVLLDRTYFLPLGDRSWSDDTLVEFEYMDDARGRQAALERVLAPTSETPGPRQ